MLLQGEPRCSLKNRQARSVSRADGTADPVSPSPNAPSIPRPRTAWIRRTSGDRLRRRALLPPMAAWPAFLKKEHSHRPSPGPVAFLASRRVPVDVRTEIAHATVVVPL